ncbi:putative P-loop containing nucleoside triphosphate hydrolase, leucine-rich repeat domain superfamily [Helianthus annuus]|uniref:P-loop containing nucleoside triphosphate hydrolase, leucine-rich repeat domain superfamily n=1 Tax=Helianthus annuus TaxID=4232 RepID=A0A251SNT3_HELAN|nr:putative P-loop containing nucleoside triphosphate hydrolase, leucine-rich repeat domain superfamily [Helianthus annuus]
MLDSDGQNFTSLFTRVDVHEYMDKMIVICEQLCNIKYNSNAEEDKVVVGFDDEIETLLDQLTGTSSTKQFQIISMIGMAGLGKTTLAKTLYNHELVEYMFDFRAWTCVSQSYQKKDLLLSILISFIGDLTDEYFEMSEQQLGERLYRKLKGCKYLVVLDDIWDCRVWNDLKMYFPDDKTGSRVLFTSRDIDVSLHVQSARPAHVLRLRNEVESWAIFEKKVFRMGICPMGFEEPGKVINRKCEGLPLAIVIAAGLLKNNLSVTWWEHIAASLRSFMLSDPRQYIDSLALSYNHLPPHLRPCFLFFGAFPEDYEVPVTKLIWLWIAQGFIHETGGRMLEDVAGDFLMNLIKRSLLMTPRIKGDGHIKTCRIHDLLHDFCLRKAEEENFLSNNYRYGMVSSMLCFPFDLGKFLQEGRSICIDLYRFLRILDVESILISLFPLDVVHLVNLRYLAIQAHDGSPHASISNLVNLQMLIIASRKNTVVPKTLWNMLNLRHLYIKSGENIMEDPSFLQVTEKDGPSVLASFQTLSQVSPRSCHNIFSRTPNLRKLGFYGPLISTLGDLNFPNLGSLVRLQKLKLLNTFSYPKPTRSCNPIMFPEKLRKLTLLNTGMDWNEMWTFAWLPNLEVLKLKFHSCIGEKWETGDAEFQKLKVLKLQDLEIKQWVCSRGNFPRLQRLLIHRCLKLDSVPMALGKIFTLEVIEVNGCSLSAYRSALNIHEEQESEGNSFLKVHGKENLY